jgi:catechol 2,3-dioxygenase-like lactoylglutathione lyase family enzyme
MANSGPPAPPDKPLAVSGVFETSLYVADLPRSYAFYHDLFGFPLIGSDVKPDDRLVALKVGDRQVLLLFRQGASGEAAAAADGRGLPHDSQGHIHVAFAVAADDIDAWERRLLDHGLTIERTIDWRPPSPGQPPVRSHYIRDPDGHLVELATPGVWNITW